MQANVLWAYAKLGERMHTATLCALEGAVQQQLPHYDSQALSNVLWAFVKLNHRPGTALLRSCGAHIMQIVDAFSPQGLVCCCSPLCACVAVRYCSECRLPTSD